MHPYSVCAATATPRLRCKLAARKAHQEASGGLTDVLGSLREQSLTLGQAKEEDAVAQAKQLEVAQGTLSFLQTSAEQGAKREEERDAATQQHRQQQRDTQQARHKMQDAQVCWCFMLR